MTPALDESKLLQLTDRAAWRAWLEQHYKTEKEIWLVYAKKHTGLARIVYNDAVEEALCFGWIDSTVKSLDADRTAQRFSVRNPKTPYSQANKERLKALIRQGRVAPEVLASLGGLEEEPFEAPANILAAIRANPAAWEHFQAFSPGYIRIRIAFIEAARKRPAEFAKRLEYFIKMTAKNQQFGFGGIEKYY
jgi:uncharacterized protein YdeI (YjbR/CyaY-like superfamily)